MPRLSGMNPILLKTLITLAASNKKTAPAGSVGSDAHLKNRIVLFADEAVNLPDWGISGLPAMILGAAPQTCLFVSDLNVEDDAKDADDTNTTASENDDDEKPAGSVSFSLTIKSPPAPESTLHARTIVWKLSLPIAGFRDVLTGANSTPVHAPVIKTRIKLGGVERDVEIGLLEMGGLDQPLLIGKDTLADKFLIRPDRPEDQKAPESPSVDLAPTPAKAPAAEVPNTEKNAETSADQNSPATPPADKDAKSDPDTKPAANNAAISDATKAAPADTSKSTDAHTPETPRAPEPGTETKAADNSEPDADNKPSSDESQTPAAQQNNASQDSPTTTADDAEKTTAATASDDDSAKTENTDTPDTSNKPEEPAQAPDQTPASPAATQPAETTPETPETQATESEKSPA